jgi:hypothetical protein
MKKLFFCGIIFFSACGLYAQWGMGAIKLGYFNPAAADGGFIIGYEGGTYIDEGFNFGWSIDWFHKNYVDRKLAGEFNNEFGGIGEINELRAKTNLHDFPLMINITGKIPVGPLVKIFLCGGVGAEVLLINYRNFENPDQDKFQAAFDFDWRVGGGVLYELGSRSEIFGELVYHASEPSWEYEVETNGMKRTFERVYDMSGVMMRVGFRFYY